MVKTDVLIIGGGLTGLTLRYLLEKEPVKTLVVEARDRPGGRIHTVRGPGGIPLEMGATWLGAGHTRLRSLLESLGVGVFPQKLGDRAFYEWISTSPHQLVALPPNQEPSYRIRGGTGTLIEALARDIPGDALFLGEAVEKITQSPSGLQVSTQKTVFEAGVVVSTLPPNLFRKTVRVEPGLPGELAGLMEETHTWMGESIKFALTFGEPFWRSQNSSGTVFSNVGPVPELYDHSSHEENGYALKGFLNGTYASLDREGRLALVLGQLRKYYGRAIEAHTAYHEAVWAREPYTWAPYTRPVTPHQNNGHPDLRQPCLGGRLILAGSETAPGFPGYMEGAVRSAEAACGLVTSLLLN